MGDYDFGDYDKVFRNLAKALRTRDAVDDATARVVASWWHGGQSSGLYAFMSTGAITDAARVEVTNDLNRAESPEDVYALRKLLEYMVKDGDRGPVAGWSEVWV